MCNHVHDSLRNDLIRFGDLLFLDAQMRQYNISGFPYISPIVLDEENKVAQCAKAICVEESLEMYGWILLEMQHHEPLFHLTSVKYIFADMKVTDTLLKNLGIYQTCML